MLIMTEELLDDYVNDCKERLENTINEFKKTWCDHYNHTVTELIDEELPYFDYYFPFKFNRSIDYLDFIAENDSLIDSFSETLLLYLTAKLKQRLMSPFRMAEGVFKFRRRGARASEYTYDRIQYKNVAYDYIYDKMDMLEKRAMFEWHLSDKTSTEIFNELFMFLYIAEAIIAPCSTFEMYEVLTEARVSLINKIIKYELEGIDF